MGLFKSLENLSDNDQVLNVRFSTIELNYNTVLENIKNGTFSNSKIQQMIANNLSVYLDYDNFNNISTRKVFQELWTNTRFLRNFLAVITEYPDNENILKYIKKNYTITINRITYDYYAAPPDDTRLKDSEVCDLLLKIAEKVDFEYIKPLTSIMDETTAKFMSLFNFSSNDTETCVERLNSLIIKAGYDFAVKDIVYIYSRFYADSFSALFNYTMTSILADLQPIEQHNSDRINLALVNILNNMTNTDIYKILSQFSSYLMLMQKASVRFSLRGLSGDYSRINEVVQLLLDEGVYLP